MECLDSDSWACARSTFNLARRFFSCYPAYCISYYSSHTHVLQTLEQTPLLPHHVLTLAKAATEEAELLDAPIIVSVFSDPPLLRSG